jgi:menaquinone-9 beta-reductase
MASMQTPVVIIGCGPAGAGASLFLSKAGIHHVIIEKEVYPRDKICGDGCSGKTTFVLHKANPEFLEEIFKDGSKFLPSYGVTFVAPNGKALEIPFSLDRSSLKNPPGFTSKRLDLDHFLFKKLSGPYATIIQDATVTGVERTGDGFNITYKTGEQEPQYIDCRLLIGADGDKGISRKKLLQDNTVTKTSAVGLRTYYTGITGLHEENFIELHFLNEILPGYFWIFPLPGGGANVGICMESALVRKKKINLKAVMQDVINNHPNIKHRFANAVMTDKVYGWGLPMGVEKITVSGDHFIITGDAASLIDPFTGEGIGNALFSGMLAAEAADKAFQQNNFSTAFLKQEYDDILFRRIGDELKLSYTIQKLLRYPWLFNMIVNKANKSSSLRTTMSSMFADLDVRALLRKPSFYWKVLTNR